MNVYEFDDSFFTALDNITVTDDSIEFFIGLMVTSKNRRVRDKLAQKIAETKNPRLIEPLVAMIKSQETYGEREGLAKALAEYDALSYMDQLISAVSDRFEEDWVAASCLRELKDKLSAEQKEKYIKAIVDEIDECDYRIDVLTDLAEELEK